VRKIWAVAIKELKQVRRDPISLIMLLVVPAMILLLFGYALNFDVRRVALAVDDRSRTQASRALIASFVRSDYFDLALDLAAAPGESGPRLGPRDYSLILERGRARGILVIPENFGAELAAGRVASVQLILDGADANTATTVLGYAMSLTAETNIALLAASVTRAGDRWRPPIVFEPRVWYNPELKSAKFLVPGLIGFILMLTAVVSTALSVVREKERGTMEQLRVTALRPAELIAGKVGPYLAISLAATTVILAVARVLFDVVVKGSHFDLFVATLIYLTGALGFGLLISSIANTQALAFQGGALLSMLPAVFLSGFIFPIRSMPVWLKAITYAVPARYYLIVARGVILKGAGLGPYARELVFLGLYAAVMLGVAYVRLARREA
jgi:ABC-2 type transport system permease protein